VKAIWPAATELTLAQMEDAAEDRRDPAPRPSDRILDLWERARVVRRRGETVEELAHQVAAPVVEARDLLWLVHCVLRSVFGAQHG
jgi:hypothetical protein